MSDKPHQRNLPVPFFSQREVKYRWQPRDERGNESGDPISLAWTTCNIVSLCMILHYYGITDDSPDEMTRKFFEGSEQWQRPVVPGDLRFGAILRDFIIAAYGIPEQGYIDTMRLDVTQVEAHITAGHPVWFSFGPLQNRGERRNDGGRGHIAVIRGFTENNDVIINDPWGDPSFADGRLRPYDFESIRGVFSFSIGRGDNSVIRRRDFIEIIRYPGTETFFQTLVIRYPHVWSFPFHANGATFRFSDHSSEARVRQDDFREEQVQAMLGAEVVENAGYPISDNRLWHDGIHITGNGPVYAIGPGRLVAARMQGEDKMPESGSSNFVLVRHRIRTSGRDKEFYSHYMHLAPVDIPQRIREQIAGQEKREEDWLDQIITRIRGKSLFIRLSNQANGKEGNRAPRIFRRTGDDLASTTDRLPDRSVIYLCPVTPDVRERLESIDPVTELQGAGITSFYNALIFIGTYKFTPRTIDGNLNDANREFYAYYHRKTGTGNSVSWEIRYVPVSEAEGIHQGVNMAEFIYYRRILARLLKGDIAVFAKEDIRRFNPPKRNARQIIVETLKSFFPEENIFITPSDDQDWTRMYNARYRDILNFYTGKIKEIRGRSSHQSDLERILRELTDRVYGFGKTLLSFPSEGITDIRNFGRESQWYKRLIGHQENHNPPAIYRAILRVAYPENNEENNRIINDYVDLVRLMLRYSTKSNIDYFIEVNGNTKLGTPGEYRNRSVGIGRNRGRNIVHFEIFSDSGDLVSDIKKEWVPESKYFVKVPECTNRNNFFNVEKIIGNLRKANFLNEVNYFTNPGTSAWIFENEIMNFLRSNRAGTSLQYAIVQHLHGHAKMDRSIWEEIIGKGRGINNIIRNPDRLREYLEYKWFSEEVVNELKHSKKGFFGLRSPKSIFQKKDGAFAVFYHPIRFLACIDKQTITGNST